MKDPKAGIIKSTSNHLVFEQTPLILNTKKRTKVATIRIKEITPVVNRQLHTIWPIRKGCKNKSRLSNSKNLS